jgi:hypothetical protein
MMKVRTVVYFVVNASLGLLMSTSYVVMTTTGTAGMMEELERKLKERGQKKDKGPITGLQGKNEETTIPNREESNSRPFPLKSTQPRLDIEHKDETELEAKMRKRREWEERKTSEIQTPIGNKQEKKEENNLSTENKGRVHRPLPMPLQATQNKSVGGTEATTGKLRDHDYYKRELQKLEESTQRIHREVDQILIEFRRNMEEYYQRTRGAAATTTFAEFKPQPLANDVEGDTEPPQPGTRLLPQPGHLPPPAPPTNNRGGPPPPPAPLPPPPPHNRGCLFF